MQNIKSCSQSFEYSNVQPPNQSVSEIDSVNCITLPKVKCAFHPHETITNFCTC